MLRGWIFYGQELSQACSNKAEVNEWNALFNKFIQMAEEGITAKEKR